MAAFNLPNMTNTPFLCVNNVWTARDIEILRSLTSVLTGWLE